MAHPYHHAVRSARLFGGTPEDCLAIHDWFDASKQITADFRHRALRHHAEGIFMAETIFGSTITLSTGRIIPTRWIGEQHVREDLGFIPSFADWMNSIRPEPWMGRALRPGVAGRSPAEDRGVILAKQLMLQACAEGEGTRTAGRGMKTGIADVWAAIASAGVRWAHCRGYLHLIRTGDGWKIADALWLPR